MDRTVCVACAGIALALGAALDTQCRAAETEPAASQATPLAVSPERPTLALDAATSETVAAVRRADQRVRGGFSRAARGAYFSARTEFVAALRTIAEAYDVQQQTAVHGRSLDAGLTALAEAGELAGLGSTVSAADLKRVIEAHRTALLKGADFATLTPAVIAQRYGAFAEQELAVAAAGEPAGSMALVGLAKVAQVAVAGERRVWSGSVLEAATFYRAALISNGNNFCAANELGVLLAQHGQFEPARDLLIRSVTISPQAATWRNLAAVHERLGETQLAAQARARADALPTAAVSPRVPAVDWVDPQTFSGISGISEAQLPPLALAQNPSIAAPSKSVAKPSSSTSKKPATTWRPWNPRR